jgi:hypothetical protein
MCCKLIDIATNSVYFCSNGKSQFETGAGLQEERPLSFLIGFLAGFATPVLITFALIVFLTINAGDEVL